MELHASSSTQHAGLLYSHGRYSSSFKATSAPAHPLLELLLNSATVIPQTCTAIIPSTRAHRQTGHAIFDS